MIAWLISIHLLTALELAVADQMNPAKTLLAATIATNRGGISQESLPRPVAIKQFTRERWSLDHEKEDEIIDNVTPGWLPLLIGQPESQLEIAFLIPVSLSSSKKAQATFLDNGIMIARDFIETIMICETDTTHNRPLGGVGKSITGDKTWE